MSAELAPWTQAAESPDDVRRRRVQGMRSLFAGAETHHGTYDHLQIVVPQPGQKVEIKKSVKTIKTAPTSDLWGKHIDGDYPLGVSPVGCSSSFIGNDSCSWGCIDIDEYNGIDHAALARQLAERELPIVVCRSKSGGAHLLLFVSGTVPAATMQRALEIVRDDLGFKGAEIFPKQVIAWDPKATEGTPRSTMTGWLNMPYFGGDDTDRYCVGPDGQKKTIDEFIRYAEQQQANCHNVWIGGLISSASPSPKLGGAAATHSEFKKWFAAVLPKLAKADRGDADMSLFKLVRDIGRWAGELGLAYEDLRDYEVQARQAWRERGKLDSEFGTHWCQRNIQSGIRAKNPPRFGDRRPTAVTRNLSAFTIAPVEWLWPGRIAVGKLSIIAGQPGLGKSQLTIHIAAQVTTGGVWPLGEGNARRGGVLLLSAEDDPSDTILPRLLAAGGDPQMVTILHAVTDKGSERTLDLSTDIDALDRALGDDDYALVIVDPISAYLGSKGKIDANSNTHIRAVLEPLKRLAEVHNVAVVCVTHLIKGGGREAISAVNGSVAFVGAPRTVMIVTKEFDEVENEETGAKEKVETGRRLVSVAKNNIGPDGADQTLVYEVATRDVGNGIVAPFVDWVDKKSITADEAIGFRTEARPGPKATKKERAMALLRKALRDGPMEVAELIRLAEAERIGRDTLENAKEAVGAKSEKAQGQYGAWRWYLPGSQEELGI